ncbi:TetR/AcrR family transcriptional regulator [Thiosulfatihalobacter marinus]|uniref:TetR/AcrR family transcriptional regulator n=1 Tax=Thiosulfatihalobacter marinus TaxID=2792481 RepID=UPI001E3E406A|nr:TetR/AcrR family transcriptional regulator [Thiosulfatihalobacter marinus]
MQDLVHTLPSTSKTQILDAAARVFMQHGVDVASIDDVARDLGATKGRIYHHFPSKGVLVAEVCLRAADFTYRKVAPVIDPAAPADENLRVMIRTHVPEVLRTLPYHKVIRQAYTGLYQKSTTATERALHQRIHDERDRYEGLFRHQIRRGMDGGAFRNQNLTVALHSILLLVNAPVVWYTPRADEPADFVDRVAHQLADMALRALT